MPRTTRKPLTEQDFEQNPTGKHFLDYARYNIGSMISSVEMKWDPGYTGMSLDLFVNDVAMHGIELAREDLAKGLLLRKQARPGSTKTPWSKSPWDTFRPGHLPKTSMTRSWKPFHNLMPTSSSSSCSILRELSEKRKVTNLTIIAI